MDWTEVREASDITPEIEDILRSFATGFEHDSASDAIDRAEGMTLADGTRLDFGVSTDSPGYKAALKIIRSERRNPTR